MNTVYLSLGSNVGDSVNILKWAIDKIDKLPGTRVAKISRLYVTEPIGYVEQDYFYNCCIAIDTEYAPIELLEDLQTIEKEGGRVRIIRWGPRTLDIDILLFNEDKIDDERLVVPHPRMFERAFTLLPILDILNTGIYYPMVRESLLKIGDSQEVKVCRDDNWEEK